MLNEQGIAMGDEEDLSTANEKLLGKLVKERVSFLSLHLKSKLSKYGN
jgi:hypothetical protein